MKRRVPLIFRNIVLRLLLMSTLSGLLTTVLDISFFQLNPQLPQLDVSLCATSIILPILVILHHTLRLWPRKYWLVVCEVLFSLVEVVATGYFFAPYLPQEIQIISGGENYFYFFSLQMAFAGSLFVIAVFSFFSFVLLFCDMLRDHFKSFLRPYDFSAGLCPPGRQWNFIWGTSVTRKRFSTDNQFIRCIRAGFAFLCLFALSALVIYTLILQPFGLGRRQGVKLSKVSVINGNTAFALETALGTKQHGKFPPLQAVLTVSGNLVSYPAMNLTQSLVYSGDYTQFPSGCQSSTISGGTVLGNCNSVLTPFNPAISGEILITIDFADVSPSFGNQLHLGMADSTDDILAGATPIDIVPGANLRGLSSISVKQQILNQQAATFGMPQYRRFAVVGVDSLNPDLSNSLLRDNHTATLRIQTRHQLYIEIEQEYVESSVLNGLALVGGVWTLINGLFAAIFGTTLLLVLFGIKPLSIYGLVHLFRPRGGSLADGGYTLSPKERDRIVGILREHLLDVECAEGDGASSCQDSPVSVLPQYTCSHCGGEGDSMIK